MRPKKRVLLYCADAVAGEQLGWMLEIRSTLLRVTTVASVEAFVRAASGSEAFDCVVVYRSKLGETPMAAGRRCADEQVCGLLREARSGGVVVELMDVRRGFSLAVAADRMVA
jgi:hypothetical protein